MLIMLNFYNVQVLLEAGIEVAPAMHGNMQSLSGTFWAHYSSIYSPAGRVCQGGCSTPMLCEVFAPLSSPARSSLHILALPRTVHCTQASQMMSPIHLLYLMTSCSHCPLVLSSVTNLSVTFIFSSCGDGLSKPLVRHVHGMTITT